MPIQNQYAGFFARRIEDAMLRQGMRIIDLSDRVGTTYETARRLVRGQVLASIPLIRKLSKTLGIGVRELRDAARNDRAHRISPRQFWLAQGIDPRLEPILLDWPYLNDSAKQSFTDFVLALASDRAQSDEAKMIACSRSGTADV